MNRLKQFKYDVIVIGKGISGLSGAIAAALKGAKVIVISNSEVNSTILAKKGVFRLPNNQQKFKQDIMNYGLGLPKESMIELLGHLFRHSDRKLRDLFSLEIADHVGKKVVGGGPVINARLESLAREVGVDFLSGNVINIGTSDSQVTSVQVAWLPTVLTLQAKSVLIANGGLGSIYAKSDNMSSFSIPGCGLALKAGAQVRDIEFIVYHPLGIKNHQTIYGTRPIYTFYDVKEYEFWGKDKKRLHEVEELVRTGAAHKKINQISRMIAKSGGADLIKEDSVLEIEPVYHSAIGGIDTDIDLQTSVKGLFAAGEAMGGLNGANRMAGMSLLECFLFGEKAGKNAAKFAAGNDYAPIDQETMVPLNCKQGMIDNEFLGEVRNFSDSFLSVIRDGRSLQYCSNVLTTLLHNEKEETIMSHVLKGILMTALAVTKASQMRTESRGAFYRKDHKAMRPDLTRSILISQFGDMLEASWEEEKIRAEAV